MMRALRSENLHALSQSTATLFAAQIECSDRLAQMVNEPGKKTWKLNRMEAEGMSAFLFRFRWEGGGDKGGPEALHHGAWEGVRRAGYSLQLHQDRHCQE